MICLCDVIVVVRYVLFVVMIVKLGVSMRYCFGNDLKSVWNCWCILFIRWCLVMFLMDINVMLVWLFVWYSLWVLICRSCWFCLIEFNESLKLFMVSCFGIIFFSVFSSLGLVYLLLLMLVKCWFMILFLFFMNVEWNVWFVDVMCRFFVSIMRGWCIVLIMFFVWLCVCFIVVLVCLCLVILIIVMCNVFFLFLVCIVFS